MGYIRHNAIVVTSWHSDATKAAAQQARDIGLLVLGPSDKAVNGYSTMLACPDGSKEGWIESNTGDRQRKAFRDWLETQRFEDRSSNLEWVEIAYGSDDREATIVASAWMTENKQ
jgi:hypothetical protein